MIVADRHGNLRPVANEHQEVRSHDPEPRVTGSPDVSQTGIGSLAPPGQSGRESDGRIQHAQQEQTLVILLQAKLSHLAHDQIPNLRQGAGSVSC
jgi:hypothetical protein